MIVETSTWPEQSFCSFFWYTEDVKRGGDNFLAQAHMISDPQMQHFLNIQKIIHLKNYAKKISCCWSKKRAVILEAK